jgi:hypothetical protein
MFVAGQLPIVTLHQGDTLEIAMTVRDSSTNAPMDFSLLRLKAQARPAKTSATTWWTVDTDVADTATNGTIVADSQGNITITLPATYTTTLKIASGFWDLVVIRTDGVVYTLVEGIFEVVARSTKL